MSSLGIDTSTIFEYSDLAFNQITTEQRGGNIVVIEYEGRYVIIGGFLRYKIVMAENPTELKVKVVTADIRKIGTGIGASVQILDITKVAHAVLPLTTVL